MNDPSTRLLEAMLKKEDEERNARWTHEDVGMFIWAALEPFGISRVLAYNQMTSDVWTYTVEHMGIAFGRRCNRSISISTFALEQAHDIEGVLMSQARATLADFLYFDAQNKE